MCKSRGARGCATERLPSFPDRENGAEMAEPTKEMMVRALRGVKEPGSVRDVVSLGFVRLADFRDGVVRVGYELPAALGAEPILQNLRQQTMQALAELPAVTGVEVEFSV